MSLTRHLKIVQNLRNASSSRSDAQQNFAHTSNARLFHFHEHICNILF